MKLTDVVVNRSRISDQIIETLKEAIRKGEFHPGDKLPREDELAKIFKVSKVSVREALKQLETQGIIEKRRGNSGGNFVINPGMNKMKDLMVNYYQFGTVTPEELLEFGQLIEPISVSLAVKRRTSEDLSKLLANIQERERSLAVGQRDSRKIIEFQAILAGICHNSFFTVVTRSLLLVTAKLIGRGGVSPEVFDADLQYSKELYDCLLRQDEEKARNSMISIFKQLTEMFQRKNNIESPVNRPPSEPK